MEKAAILQSEAAQVVAPMVQCAAPKVAGLSFREVADFEVTDKSQLPDEYLIPDLVRIGKVVKALKTDARIPGVRVWLKKVPASGAS